LFVSDDVVEDGGVDDDVLDAVSDGVTEDVLPGVDESLEGAVAVVVGDMLEVDEVSLEVDAVDGSVAGVDEPGVALAPELL
jgi:hypothetical protein